MNKYSHSYIEVGNNPFIKSYEYIKDDNGRFDKEILTGISSILIDCVFI